MHLIYSIVKVLHRRPRNWPAPGWLYDCGREIRAAREEILGFGGLGASCQDGSTGGPRDRHREASPNQLAADHVEELAIGWRGLPGVQAFRDLSGGRKLLGLAELGHRCINLGPIDAPRRKLGREPPRASHGAPAANKGARERLVVEVAELLEASQRRPDLCALIAPPRQLKQQLHA